ncbi:MAG TPA: sigma 54-interacting transcriptional regulator [Oligoflexus sp.]|uniref:sigma 54-interacting transcriptional regulator n=1 Tax=Oligoflexus sp. TaxID=1971216 RepID=UPI002D367130|nr:sigma 54-interacting transcriptional regulator [Oligoflexus sp.]HYX32150.1 sigma 54-interacting transcriptional regulator [Oligoflexus sp.]
MQKTTLTAVHALEFPRATHAKDYRPALPAMSGQTDSLLQGFVLGPAWYDLAKKIARNPRLPTLIYGETGTGKEQFAKLIHELLHPILTSPAGLAAAHRFAAFGMEWSFVFHRKRVLLLHT